LNGQIHWAKAIVSTAATQFAKRKLPEVNPASKSTGEHAQPGLALFLRRNVPFTSRSRVLFADNFRCQNARLFFGLILCIWKRHPPSQPQINTDALNADCRPPNIARQTTAPA